MKTKNEGLEKEPEYSKLILEVEKSIPRRQMLKDHDIEQIYAPIRVDRAYVSGIANPDTHMYYSRAFEQDMFQRYTEVYNGYPPLVFRDPKEYTKSKNAFMYVEDNCMLGVILECNPDHFMVEPKGLRSRKIIERLLELGYKANYDLLCKTRPTSVYDGKTDSYIQVNEIYGSSRIVCVNMKITN